jgi:beta-phosphoglucomutase-like phosphatase (HAD superfamily)
VTVEAALLDVDGTVIDSDYQHALAWYRAFRRHGIVLPVWRVHRAVGMGGDQLVPALVGPEVDRDVGDAVRDSRTELYHELNDEVAPLDGAHELIVDLKERGLRVVLASSSPEDERDHRRLVGAGAARRGGGRGVRIRPGAAQAARRNSARRSSGRGTTRLSLM